ncbi:TPA: GGDEF domain-containing protein [Klebsiella pneumoniae]
MSSLSIRSFTLFREEQPVRDALVLFTLTLLLHFLGAMLRLVQELSFFWPLNAVMAGIFARYVWLNRSYFYAVCFAAMLVYDGLTSRWGMGFASLLINFSNIVFIVTLTQFAQQVRQLVGEQGMVARIGGEEFAVAAVVDSAQQGYLLAEKIRHGVESQPFGLGQNPIHLTISLGLETREVGHARITELFNQLLLAADDEMVKAKQSGRNQICMPTLTESAP